MTTSRYRLARFAFIAAVFGLLAAIQYLYFQRGLIPGDAFNYLAAGERLNAGHSLYSLSPGDRPVDIHPPYWTAAFMSPPPMAVLFRAFALLGDAGAYAWWGLQLAALATAVVLLLRRRPILTAAALIVLAFPLVYEVGVGNVNSFLLLGLILTWRAFATADDRTAGIATGLASAVKLTPAIVGWWLLTQSRSRAVALAVATAVAVGVVSLLGAGLDAHVEYATMVLNGTLSPEPAPLSIGGMARYVGVPLSVARLLPFAAIALGLVLVWLVRDRPAWGYRVAVLTMVAGSPLVSINWFVLLLALLAPVAWPIGAREEHVRAPARLTPTLESP